MTTSEVQEAARCIVRDMVSTSVREAMDSLAEELRQEVSRHMDTRIRDTSQRQDPPTTPLALPPQECHRVRLILILTLAWGLRPSEMS